MKFALFPLELTNCVLDITFPIEWLNLIGIITILNTERMIAIIRESCWSLKYHKTDKDRYDETKIYRKIDEDPQCSSRLPSFLITVWHHLGFGFGPFSWGPLVPLALTS